MVATEIYCAIVSYLLSKHKWNTPRPKDEIVNRAGVRSDQQGDVKKAVEELRRQSPWIEDHKERGIAIDNSKNEQLAQYLYFECEWDDDEIKKRMKHFEGFNPDRWLRKMN